MFSFSKTTLNKVLRELFYPLRAQKNFGQQHGLLDRQASQYGSRLDWSRDEFRQSLCKNPGPINKSKYCPVFKIVIKLKGNNTDVNCQEEHNLHAGIF